MCDQEIDFMNSFYKKEDHSSHRRRKDFLFVFLVFATELYEANQSSSFSSSGMVGGRS